MAFSSTLFFWLLIFVVVPFIVKRLWPFMVTRLFPKAVEEDYITREISWIPAIIIGLILLAVTF